MPYTTVFQSSGVLFFPGGGEAENGFVSSALTGSQGLVLPNGRYLVRVKYCTLGAGSVPNARRAALFPCCTTNADEYNTPATLNLLTSTQNVVVSGVGTVWFEDTTTPYYASISGTQLLGAAVGGDTCVDALQTIETDFRVFGPTGLTKIFIYMVGVHAAYTANTYLLFDFALSSVPQ